MREAVVGEEEDLGQQLRERERDDDDDGYDVLRFALTLILDFDDDFLRFASTVILDFDDDVLGFCFSPNSWKSQLPSLPPVHAGFAGPSWGFFSLRFYIEGFCLCGKNIIFCHGLQTGNLHNWVFFW